MIDQVKNKLNYVGIAIIVVLFIAYDSCDDSRYEDRVAATTASLKAALDDLEHVAAAEPILRSAAANLSTAAADCREAILMRSRDSDAISEYRSCATQVKFDIAALIVDSNVASLIIDVDAALENWTDEKTSRTRLIQKIFDQY